MDRISRADMHSRMIEAIGEALGLADELQLADVGIKLHQAQLHAAMDVKATLVTTAHKAPLWPSG